MCAEIATSRLTLRWIREDGQMEYACVRYDLYARLAMLPLRCRRSGRRRRSSRRRCEIASDLPAWGRSRRCCSARRARGRFRRSSPCTAAAASSTATARSGAARRTGPSAWWRPATSCCSPTASPRAACARSARAAIARSFPPIVPRTPRLPRSGWPSSRSWMPRRLGLMGWSHGAMTVLWTVRKGFMQGPQFKAAIGLYPGCREIAKLARLAPRRAAHPAAG